MRRYTVAVDFDGVLHSYVSPWVNARTISDPPVPGAMEWLADITRTFDVAIMSTRNFQFLGAWAMKRWLRSNLATHFFATTVLENFSILDAEFEADKLADSVMSRISFPKKKVPALVYLDDRAIRFEGSNWPTRDEVFKARPWNKAKAQSL